jgi:hypothetical protein
METVAEELYFAVGQEQMANDAGSVAFTSRLGVNVGSITLLFHDHIGPWVSPLMRYR